MVPRGLGQGHRRSLPDIIVDNGPDNRGKKEDLQLKAAVDELLKQIGNK